MYVSIEIPEISEFPEGFPAFWVTSLFVQSLSEDFKVNALVSSYIRLVESALREYRYSSNELKSFWEPSMSLNLRAMHKAITHFETCITNMHRARNCYKKIRKNQELPTELKKLLSNERPTFINDNISRRLADVRNQIHHQEEHVLKGEIPEGTQFLLSPYGEETPVDDEPNQTLKKFDRLKIGNLEILFLELSQWLTEIGRLAEIISSYHVNNRRQ